MCVLSFKEVCLIINPAALSSCDDGSTELTTCARGVGVEPYHVSGYGSHVRGDVVLTL